VESLYSPANCFLERLTIDLEQSYQELEDQTTCKCVLTNDASLINICQCLASFETSLRYPKKKQTELGDSFSPDHTQITEICVARDAAKNLLAMRVQHSRSQGATSRFSFAAFFGGPPKNAEKLFSIIFSRGIQCHHHLLLAARVFNKIFY